MRVISGSAKGRRLRPVPGTDTRPITDRVKEALFDIVGPDVADSAWWDIFGGTGAVGIEALSRGAAYARFTDLHRGPVETMDGNLMLTGLRNRAEVRQANAFTLMAARPDRQFDYLFVAPPQYQGLWSQALATLDANDSWLSPDAWIVAQLHPKEYLPLELAHLAEFDTRKYGTTLLAFFERKRP
jgi:16S rRNA (guanine966-N2)-methyltransferase